MQIPERGSIYSINEGNEANWDERVRDWVRWLKTPDKAGGRPYSARYIGTLVADFHRTLLKGGVFAYPADSKNPNGKLRLLYEAAPMALLATRRRRRGVDRDAGDPRRRAERAAPARPALYRQQARRGRRDPPGRRLGPQASH